MKRLLLVSTVSFSLCGLTGVAFADGAKVFNAKCASCHGKDGAGKTPMGQKKKTPDLATSKASDADIIKLVTDGKEGDKHPAFKGKLKDDEIKEVSDFSKTFRK